MSVWSIYGLRDSPEIEYTDPHVRYIGKSRNPYRRVKEHCVQALEAVMEWRQEVQEYNDYRREHGRNEDPEWPEAPAPFTMWLGTHWEECHLPEVILLETGRGEESWRERERYWIGVARTLGLDLYNQTRGG